MHGLAHDPWAGLPELDDVELLLAPELDVELLDMPELDVELLELDVEPPIPLLADEDDDDVEALPPVPDPLPQAAAPTAAASVARMKKPKPRAFIQSPFDLRRYTSAPAESKATLRRLRDLSSLDHPPRIDFLLVASAERRRVESGARAARSPVLSRECSCVLLPS